MMTGGHKKHGEAGTNIGVARLIRAGGVAGLRFIAQGAGTGDLFRDSAPKEVKTFSSTCGSCNASCETRMFVTKIPDFQEVTVMAFTCKAGHRNSKLNVNEIVPAMGKKVILSVKNIRDLSRDVIKSDTASVVIPEIKLELASGSLGGLVTTVEGLITKISQSLKGVYGFGFGGSSFDDNRNIKWQDFPTKLMKLTSVEEPWTLILDDALADSFVAPVTGNISEDHQLTFEEYERSWERNEELGLNGMDTSSVDAAYND